jgi:putative membrane protein insertion efficiency factor
MVHHRYSLLLIFLLAATVDVTLGACQSCLVDLTVSSLLGYDANNKYRDDTSITMDSQRTVHGSALPLALLRNRPDSLSDLNLVDSSALRFLVVRKLMSVAYNKRVRSRDTNEAMPTSATAHRVQMKNKSRWAGGFFTDKISEADDSHPDEEKHTNDSINSKSGDGGEVMSGSMIMAIGFYKQWISPLLPPACRFLPTCSQYGVQAIKEFGPTKGVILTAWRLARCTPLGGRGYDPPKWPPVLYTYGSY